MINKFCDMFPDGTRLNGVRVPLFGVYLWTNPKGYHTLEFHIGKRLKAPWEKAAVEIHKRISLLHLNIPALNIIFICGSFFMRVKFFTSKYD